MARKTLPGNMRAYYLTAAPSSLAAPDEDELAAGTDLIGSEQDEEMESLDGWVVNSSIIATPGMASHQIGNVAGDETYPASSMTFYKDDTVETIYSAMVKGQSGYVVLAYDGEAVGDECEVFPVTIQSRIRLADRGSASRFRVNFAIGVPVYGAIAAGA